MNAENLEGPPSWDEFKAGLPDRFELPVYDFEYRVRFVPVVLGEKEQATLFNQVRQVVVQALKSEPQCDLAALQTVLSPNSDAMTSKSDGENIYFAIVFTNPVFDFRLRVGPTTLLFEKQNTTQQNLLHTVRLFSLIMSGLFPPPVASGGGLQPFDAAGITSNIYRVAFRFEHHLELGDTFANQEPATNTGVLEKLLRLKSGVIPEGIQPDPIWRGDVTLAFGKAIDGRLRELWFEYEGPWNVTQRDVDITLSYRMGGAGTTLEDTDLRDFRTPLMSFYRDLILKDLFAGLFADCEVRSRV